MTVSTAQVGGLGTHAGGSQSSADVGRAAYRLDDLVATAVHSDCIATGAGSTASMTIGTVAFSDKADGSFKQFTNYSPPPNTTFNIFEGGTVIFNEQTVLDSGQTTGISITAIDIEYMNLDIKVGLSTCAATGPDVVVTPQPGPHTTLTVTTSTAAGTVPLTVVYTYEETSDGTDPLAGITLTDNTCSPVNVVNGDSNNNAVLDPGETWKYVCVHTFTSAGTYTSTAVATGVDKVVGATHTEQTKTTVVVSPLLMGCNLQITKTMTPTPLISGQAATVTLKIVNLGPGPCAPGPLPGTAVYDPKPAGLTFTSPPAANPQLGWACSFGNPPTGNASCRNLSTLPAGYTATFTIPALVTATTGTIKNCATVTNANDTITANNQYCTTVPVV